MANLNCDACESIRQDDPNLIVNGFTDTECASLQNNTGLNPSSGNDDCEDLNNLNDCLVGNMETEVDAYDVCDWKTFMKKFIPNVWTVLKAMICAICGLWSNLSGFDRRINALCDLMSFTYSPPVARYGVLPNTHNPERVCGTIATKSGNPLLIPMTYQEVVDAGVENIWEYQQAGVNYGSFKSTSCKDDSCVNNEWISPGLLLYRISSVARMGDVIWYCTKAEALNVIGMSEQLWNIFSTVGYTWKDYGLGDRKTAYVRLIANGSRLEMRFEGTSYPNSNFTENMFVEEPENPHRLYTTSC